jgi:hypothetical protein
VSEVLQSLRGERLCVSLLLEQVVIDGLGLLEGSGRAEEAAWVEEVQGVHRQKDHGTVHSVEVEFGGDDPTLPSVGELDGSVHGSDVDSEGAESTSVEHRLHLLVHEVVAGWWLVVRALEGLVGEITDDEFDSEDHIDGDGDHLEDDTAQHDSTTHFRVPVVTGGDCSDGTANTLNGEGDDISGEEDNGVCE